MLKKYLITSIGLVATLVGIATYFYLRQPTPADIDLPRNTLTSEERQTEQAFFEAATAFQQKLKWLREESDSYPYSYDSIGVDPYFYDTSFTTNNFSYHANPDLPIYTICFKTKLVYNQPCFDRNTFIVDPSLAPDINRTLSETQLKAQVDQVIHLVQHQDLDDSGAEKLLTQMYLSASDSAEFATAYAWYRFQAGYNKNNEYLADDWDAAAYYLNKAREKKPGELNQVRLRIDMALHENEYAAADKLITLLEKTHPDSDWPEYYRAIRLPSTSARATALDEILTKTADGNLKWNGYWALIAEREQLGNDKVFFETIETMLAEFGPHPWIYQHKGNYLLDRDRYTEAISSYEQGIATKDIPILHTNLAYAYTDYGYEFYYQKHNDYDSAISSLRQAIDEHQVGDIETQQFIYSKLVPVYYQRGLANQSPSDIRLAISYGRAIANAQPATDRWWYDDGVQRMERELATMEQRLAKLAVEPLEC